MTKLRTIITLLLLLSSFVTHAQDNKMIEGFKSTKNDSLFINKYSITPFQVYEAEIIGIPYKHKNWVDSLVFQHEKGDVLGPFKGDSTRLYIKVLSVDSTLRMRVGNIWLNGSASSDSIKTLGQLILTESIANKRFDNMCHLYTGDNNKNFECDLNWFFQGVMVSEFESAVLKHKKGEIFAVDTRFGKHIVKIIDNPKKDRNRVKYVVLELKGND